MGQIWTCFKIWRCLFYSFIINFWLLLIAATQNIETIKEYSKCPEENCNLGCPGLIQYLWIVVWTFSQFKSPTVTKKLCSRWNQTRYLIFNTSTGASFYLMFTSPIKTWLNSVVLLYLWIIYDLDIEGNL